MKIVLISCVSMKQSQKAKAVDMYISPWFKYAVGYAKTLKADRAFILSAKYGLLKYDDIIEPYELTLNKMLKPERIAWSDRVLCRLREEADMQNDYFIFLAGQRYRENLIKHMADYSAPLSALGIGKQLQYMKNSVENSAPEC